MNDLAAYVELEHEIVRWSSQNVNSLSLVSIWSPGSSRLPQSFQNISRRLVVSIWSFVSDAIEFARVLQTSHMNGWFLFVKRTSYLRICFFAWFWGIEKLEEFPDISSKTWCHGLSLISNNPHTRCEHLCVIFSASVPSGSNLFSITGIKVMTSGIAFDRPDRLSRLRAFPYDRFKIYMIVPIVRIELNSIQAIEVVSVVRVVCDRLGSVSIWSSRSSEHFLRRLGRSGRSGRSYGN